MPEVKHFIYESVLKNQYRGLSVQFIPGAAPELVTYKKQAGGEAEEVSREALGDLSVEQLHEFVQARGFQRQAAEEQSPGPGSDDTEVEEMMLPFDGEPVEYDGEHEEL